MRRIGATLLINGLSAACASISVVPLTDRMDTGTWHDGSDPADWLMQCDGSTVGCAV